MPQPTFCYETDTKVLVALGSNATSHAGNPLQTIISAILKIPNRSVQLLATSRLFQTPAVPAGAGPDFVNAAILCQTTLSPHDLLQHLHRIEQDFARNRTVRWDARTLDLDLLAYGDCVVPDSKTFLQWKNLDPAEQMRIAPDQLILPHPRLQDRAFVLVPLADLAPDWCHPVLGETVTDMLARLPAADRDAIRPI